MNSVGKSIFLPGTSNIKADVSTQYLFRLSAIRKLFAREVEFLGDLKGETSNIKTFIGPPPGVHDVQTCLGAVEIL